MPEFEVGAGAALCIDNRDETRISTKYNLQDGREALEDTTFQSAGYAKEYAYGLMSGAASNGGFLALDKNVVATQMATVVGKNRIKHKLLIGPSGLILGREACFFETLQNSFNVEKSVSGLTMADAAYATTRSGIRDGICLHSLHGADSLDGHEKARLVFADADPNQFFGLRATGANGYNATDLATFRLADYATDALLTAALKTKIEALTAYAGRTATLTVVAPRSGGAAVSLVLQVEFDSRVNLPDLQAISGVVDSFAVNGGNSGNYSVNGGATFTLPITEVALQTNQQAVNAGVIVKGSSVGATGVATPTNAPVFNTGASGSFVNGTYLIGYTYLNAQGETALSPLLTYTRPNGEALQFGITPMPAGATKFRLYISSPGGNASTMRLFLEKNTVNDQTFTIGNYDPAGALAPTVNTTGSAASANFKFYYPVSATPAAPTATGTGANVTRAQIGGTASPSLGTNITQGGVATDATYNIVSASGADQWIDNGAQTDVGYAFRSHLISLADNATLAVILEHADGTAAAPNPATIATLATHNYNASGAQGTVDHTVSVKRWTRCRYVLVGTQAVFAAALAR